MDTKRYLWAIALPYGKWAEYVAEYADAVVADDTAQVQVAVLSLPFQCDVPMVPLLSPVSAFGEVDGGGEVYAVGVPFGNLDGGWVDDDGIPQREPSILTDDAYVANTLGKAYNQQTILRVSAMGKGTDGYLYLLKDTPANRGIALAIAGGYTAGDGYLLVASETELPVDAVEGEVQSIPATLKLIYL